MHPARPTTMALILLDIYAHWLRNAQSCGGACLHHKAASDGQEADTDRPTCTAKLRRSGIFLEGWPLDNHQTMMLGQAILHSWVHVTSAKVFAWPKGIADWQD